MKYSSADTKAFLPAHPHLHKAAAALDTILQHTPVLLECPLEARAAMAAASESIQAALACLDTSAPDLPPGPSPSAGAPTRQQGQFLAYIREYMRSNFEGVAPTHAALQKFFNLTPPSVNSMLIRLEQRGFIRRTPGQARGIRLTVIPEHIPPLERPFKM